MKCTAFPLILLAVALSGAALAQEDMTLQQERDQIGADMVDNRRQVGQDINGIREPVPAGTAEEAAGGATGPDIGVNSPRFDTSPATSPSRTIQDRPATTPAPTGSTTAPAGGTVSPVPPNTGGGVDVQPGAGSTGGNGTPANSGGAATPSGGAATPSGGGRVD
ncbi:hypothetical protein DN824_04800 [Stutzerimonas nosocomialis]|uniref:hypothetical protein n=1 Tax=Stutzerimonas nosocomialis TaxID=1056496 RepID=UPI001108197D|nr:hypothetical protein [Stutzerimonas nosocomialis]TLX60535.1 hypothetical protein DN824_04800 [Stutzerimonas nosocomialis]